MQRIDTATAIDEMFTDGNPETGRKATQFNAAWCNAVQEEIANAVEKNGEVLDPKDSSQLFRATSQLKTFECAPGDFDFGEWRGSSIVRVKTLGDLIFPAKAKCPKSAAVLVVFPWLADSGTSVTVAQVEGSPFGCLRGNVAFGFFDENGSLSGCFNIPQWAAFSIASFGLLSCESLKVSGAIDAGSGSIVRLKTEKVETETVEISGGGKTVSVTAAVSPASSSGKKAVFDSAVRMDEIDARYSYEITSATSYDLTSKWNGSQDENQGRMFMLYNQASAQCRVKISSTAAGDMFVPLNAGNIGAFIRVGWSEGASIFAPVNFDRTVTVSGG